jgi:hypothetical protein
MAQLYKVHGGERALCPFTGNCCYTDCAWLIPYFCNDGEVGAYTCCMNNLDRAALMTAEQLEQYKEERKNQEGER